MIRTVPLLTKNQLLDKVFSRINVISEIKECLGATFLLNNDEKPIGVDLEGINGPPGLIQVANRNGDIFLFRTGINMELFENGGIKDLIENPKVLKVMHEATVDNLSFAQAGIRLNSLFDTSLAHKIIDYQKDGTYFTANNISFNNVCEKFGFESNPLKDKFRDFAWIRNEKRLFNKKDLEKDLLIYCAFDVYPLLELHEAMDKLIEPDFRPIFQELCENHCLRPFDKDAIKEKQNRYRREMKTDVFLDCSKSKEKIIKLEIFELLKEFEDFKVFISEKNNTAHVLSKDASTANEICKTLDLKFGKLGSTKLLVPLKNEEVDIEDPRQKLHKFVKIIKSNKIPILLHLGDNEISGGLSLEVYFLQDEKLKIDVLDNESLKLIMPLITDEQVIKIVPRLSVKPVLDFLKMCNSEEKNMFDLDSAAKICDFLFNGVSPVRSNSQSVKSLCEFYGINYSTWKDEPYDLFFHIHNILPKEAETFYGQLFEAVLSNSKTKKKEFVKNYETFTIHLTTHSENNKLLRDIKVFLGEQNIQNTILWSSNRNALVKIHEKEDISLAIQFLKYGLNLKRCQKIVMKNKTVCQQKANMAEIRKERKQIQEKIEQNVSK